MEGKPLRSVPGRLPGPVNPVHALAQVQVTLPELGSAAQRALAVVDLGGLSRAEAAGELELSEAELSRVLATARKALRRTLASLPSDGWCERAERLISDRLDDALAPNGRARLDAHLSSCERCVAHERKLIQAHDLLVESYLAAHAPPRPREVAVEAAPPAAELRVIPASPAEPEPSEGEHVTVAWYVAYGIAVLAVVALIALIVAGLIHIP
jgi:hypothetical protein